MNSSPAPLPEADERDYWSQTRQPLVSLVFLLPLLAVYEAGVLWLGGSDPEALRTGADYWMRGWLHGLGFTQALVLPLLVVAGLLTWQAIGRFPWRVAPDTLAGMFAESLLFAFALVLLGQLQDMAFHLGGRWTVDGGETCWLPSASWLPLCRLDLSAGEAGAARAIGFVGAGIYEEVLFRLCLLPAAYGLFRLSRLSVRWSAALAVLASSLVFSFAHYVGGAGEGFALFTFTFRTTAGLFFAALFVLRGFGITVGSHAAYDLLVGVLLDAASG